MGCPEPSCALPVPTHPAPHLPQRSASLLLGAVAPASPGAGHRLSNRPREGGEQARWLFTSQRPDTLLTRSPDEKCVWSVQSPDSHRPSSSDRGQAFLAQIFPQLTPGAMELMRRGIKVRREHSPLPGSAATAEREPRADEETDRDTRGVTGLKVRPRQLIFQNVMSCGKKSL